MKKRVSLFFTYFLFWYLFFVVSKIIFLIYEFPLSKQLNFIDLLKVLLYGSKMDISMAGYYMLIPGLLFLATTFTNGKIFARILNIYTGILLFISGFLVVADMELYRFWGFRMDTTPLMYLKNPKEAIASINMMVSVFLIVFWLGYCWLVFKLYLNLIGSRIRNLEVANWKVSLVFVPLTALLILPIRGSVGIAPMNIGFVYFHKTNVYANHAAINVVWNIFYAFSTHNVSKPYIYFDKAKAEKIVTGNYIDNGKPSFLLNSRRPNVMVIIMESFTAKIIEPLGGREGIAPNLSALCREGILFDHCYANGDRTDKGVIAILNGYPGHPKNSIINFPKKIETLPYLNKDFKKQGYYTEYVYGSDVDFANFRSYFINAGYDKVISKNDFDLSLRTSEWGVHDHYVFDRAIKECNATPKKPFFVVCESQSSHEPFDVPMKTKIHGSDEESLFLNAAYYADSSLGDFIRKAKNTSWWNNTLIIIVADHGSRHPGNTTYNYPIKFHIPMLWLGGAIAKHDTVISTYFSQSDFPLTLLHQLNLDNKNYRFSQDFLSDRAPAFSFYVFNDGFGFLRKDGYIIFDNVTKKVLSTQGSNTDQLISSGKAQMQVLSTNFSER
jgi:phosphoglycerol transferase MdoB-like AlkP superfamily enzyme